jgi:hypothetical protein
MQTCNDDAQNKIFPDVLNKAQQVLDVKINVEKEKIKK